MGSARRHGQISCRQNGTEKRTIEERSMTAEQTSGDDDNKVESDEFHWLSADLGMNNHTAMSLAVTRPTAG